MSTGQPKENTDIDIYLGTANFGQSYGKVQSSHGVDFKAINEIFELIENHGSIHLDTAPGYGQAEKVIGELGAGRNLLQRITTKISPKDYGDPNEILQSVKKSLELLGTEQFENILLHGLNESLLCHKSAVAEGLNLLAEENLTRNFGLSCYSEEEVLLAKHHFPMLNVFQVPENVVDQRLYNSTKLLNLSQTGNKFIVRSIFLQGKLLEENFAVGSRFDFLTPIIEDLENNARLNGLSRYDYCVAYIKNIPWKTGVVIGVESLEQMKSFLTSQNYEYPKIGFNNKLIDDLMVDPRNWPQG